MFVFVQFFVGCLCLIPVSFQAHGKEFTSTNIVIREDGEVDTLETSSLLCKGNPRVQRYEDEQLYPLDMFGASATIVNNFLNS